MPEVVFVALQQFCEQEEAPLRLLLEAGLRVRCNRLGRRLRREEMPELLKQADAVIAGVEPYDGELLRQLPKLRLISRCGAGTDAIDEKTAQTLHIAIRTTPEEVVEPVAQLTMAMILSLARNLPLSKIDFRNGEWKKRSGFLLSEWTIGLVGFGRIGRKVAEYLKPFGPRLLTTDPKVQPADLPAGIKWCDLPGLLRESDLVSLHVGGDVKKGPLIGERELSWMKPGGFLVNTARGFLVDEKALQRSLEGGRLAGAALDVFEEEPYSGPLAAMPQVLLTPHAATLTRASRAAMELRCAQNVIDFFAKVFPQTQEAVRS